MKLSCDLQRCLNGFFAEICPGDRPVFRILHKISCDQADVGILIGEYSDYAGASPDILIQPLNHVGGRDLPGIQIRKTVKGQGILQAIFKACHSLWKAFCIGINQVIGPFPGSLC